VPAPTLSTTSYALLGYLAVRPWSGYELAKQLGRSFHHFWPRAESGIYREARRLVDAGLATAHGEHVGRRARTRYEITSAGRDALRAWLAEPRSDGFLESEALVRLLFADHGTKGALVELLAVMVRDAGGRADQMHEFVRDYLVTGGQFPRRSHINILVAKFLIDFAVMVRDWAAWSQAFVETWPDVAERDPDEATMARFGEVAASAWVAGSAR
jgi:DNA-binding PadR family transcriptional regulator